MKARIGLAALFAVGALAWSADAAAADEPAAHNFGDKGQLMVSGDRFASLFSYTRSSVTASTTAGTVTTTTTTSNSSTSLAVLWAAKFGSDLDAGSVHTMPRVAFDYTVIDRLTIGGAFAFTFGLGGTRRSETVATGAATTTTETDRPTGTAFGFAPRIGYIIPLSPLFAFWPRAGAAFYSVSLKSENITPAGTTTSSASTTTFSLDLDPQFVIVPVEHFFIHAGPVINVPLTGSVSVKTTAGPTTTETSNDLSIFQFGLSAGIGGWL